MKIIFILSLILMMGCSKDLNLDPELLSFKYSKEVISNPIILEEKIKSHLQNTDLIRSDELFQKSWIAFFSTTSSLENKFLVEVVEHQPIAILGKKRYLTQEGKIISPDYEIKDLNLIKLVAQDNKVNLLLSYAGFLQATLNSNSYNIVKLEDKGSGFLEATDNRGRRYNFSEENFRVQLERLEDFLLFKLNSGKEDDIRYIDLRYKNALAVGYKNMEKTI